MALTRKIETAVPSLKETNLALKARSATSLALKKPLVLQGAIGSLILPSAPSVPSDNLIDYSWLIYGAKKIGKTSLAAQFPGALFFMFEPGAKALSVFQVDCKTWKHALGYLDLLEKAPKPLQYKTIVIDTGFEAYQKCFHFVCDELSIEYPREDNFGKDWKRISDEFRSFHSRIVALDMGLVVLCHEQLKESMTRTGNKFNMVVPNLASAPDALYRAVIDNVAWYHYRNKERFLLVKGSDYAMAGTAASVELRFLTKDGKQIYAIPMGSNAKEGYAAVTAAWNNKQIESFKDETIKFTDEAVRTSVHENLKKRK